MATYDDIHDISGNLLEALDGEDTSKAVMGLALTLGRLMGGPDITSAQEKLFVQSVLEWSSMFFTEGKVN